MKISLHQLNQSYQALDRLANRELPKDQHKLAYKISRVYKQAKAEIEALSESLQTLATRCGLTPGEREVDPAKIEDYNKQARKFQKETDFEFPWGDQIPFSLLRDHVTLSPADLAELDWLICFEEEEKEPKAKAGANAT